MIKTQTRQAGVLQGTLQTQHGSSVLRLLHLKDTLALWLDAATGVQRVHICVEYTLMMVSLYVNINSLPSASLLEAAAPIWLDPEGLW